MHTKHVGKCLMLSLVIGLVQCSVASAFQDIAGWKLVRVRSVETVPVESTRMVEETSYETQTRETSQPVWQRETRQREVRRLRPVTETRERVERQTVLKPKTVTKYRDREIQETSYREVTRYRDEQYTVVEPVVETGMREQRVTVQKPVSESMVEVNRTTSFRPVTETKTEYVQRPGLQYQAIPDPYARPRVRLLRPGYYTDPGTGLTVYRRGGLHWTQPQAALPVQTAPVLVPEQRTETRFIPETIETRRPVELTRMVEETRTEQVPYQVEKMVERTATRRVPYTVIEPVRTTRVERVPYTETVYEEEVITKRVPYTEEVMKEVVEYEPYEIEVQRWVPKTEEVRIPKTVKRPKTVTVDKEVVTYKWMKVAVDANGNEIGEPVEIAEGDGLLAPQAADQPPAIQQPVVQDESTTQGRVFAGKPVIEGEPVTNVQDDEAMPVTEAEGDETLKRIAPVAGDGKTILETSDRQNADINAPAKPEADDSNRTGDESAADRRE